MIDTLQIYQDLAETLNEVAARKLAAALGTIYRDLQQTVSKEDFRDLKQPVGELAEAQKRTDARLDLLAQHVNELAEAQKRTEAQVGELVEAQKRTETRLQELAEAQKHTDARLDLLAQRVNELAEAQKRTEARLQELAEAQKRADARLDLLAQRVNELAEAQKRTDAQLEILTRAMDKGFRDFHSRLGVLGARWGDGAEETFRRGLLETVSDLGYTVQHYHGEDPEGFINYTPRSFDLDVLVQNSETVVAEIKSNASGADVTEFHRAVLLFERQTGRRATKRMLVAVTLQQAALERAKELGIIVATSFIPELSAKK